jgi:predicted ABC-type ATPase
LIDLAEDFAIETTLSSRQYQTRIQQAHQKGFQVVLIFFWLQTVQLAKKRVRERVRLGGHSIPPHVIERRYY